MPPAVGRPGPSSTSVRKAANRLELAKALALCKRRKATLLIARLDRLARNVHFISGLMEAEVKFVACNMPEATPFLLHIYAAVAQEEARAISARTKTALAAAKHRGVRLGATGAERAKRFKAEAQARANELSPIVRDLKKQGLSFARHRRRVDEETGADAARRRMASSACRPRT